MIAALPWSCRRIPSRAASAIPAPAQHRIRSRHIKPACPMRNGSSLGPRNPSMARCLALSTGIKRIPAPVTHNGSAPSPFSINIASSTAATPNAAIAQPQNEAQGDLWPIITECKAMKMPLSLQFTLRRTTFLRKILRRPARGHSLLARLQQPATHGGVRADHQRDGEAVHQQIGAGRVERVADLQQAG